MIGPQHNPPLESQEKSATLDEEIEAILKLATVITEGNTRLTEIATDSVNGLKAVREQMMPMLRHLNAEQDKLRGMLLSKMDGLQGTMDLVREDTRNAWGTTDFAISNLRHTREDTDKIPNIMSVMQKQQQLLTSQVEELRKRAAETDQGL